MRLYLVASFSTDDKIENNPPLSDEGIRQAKNLRLTLPKVEFDYCFSSFSVCDYGSAMLIVGDRVLIDRDARLKVESVDIMKKNIFNFSNYLVQTFQDKNILVVADKIIIQIIKEHVPEAIIL